MELKELKGIGKTRLAQLADAGIFDCFDLINFFPKKYYDFSYPCSFEEDNLSKIVLAEVLTEPKVVRFKGMNYAICKAKDQKNNIFNVIWYNQPYIKSAIKIGLSYYLYGKNSPKKKNTFVVSLTKEKSKVNGSLLPVYKKIGSFGSQNMSALIQQAIDDYDFVSVVDGEQETKHNLIDLKSAYQKVHMPKSQSDFEKAKVRIDVEKLVPLAMKNIYQTIYATENRLTRYNDIEVIYQQFLKLLPYTLTDDQQRAIADIIKDLSGAKSMNRLLQGEVGSGKTMVAFFCLYLAVKNGFQGAIIAPTEILASQHYANLQKTLSQTGIHVVMLASSLKAAEKREILRQIKLGVAQIVVGTHAIISDAVEFKNLSMAVIDEQHRFGVVQRAKLASKGTAVDTLVMSATPIPRSMALALYGNLNLSIIKRCPFAKDITTNIVPRQKQPEMWQYLREKAEQGSKIFVVCSNIDTDDDDENLSATNVHKQLCNLFGKDKISLVHGRLDKASAIKTMNEFATGEKSVLVATTVIEVGVDVPEADIIVIMSPEKFGLATLHQLRGRIGRNGAKSYCFCLSHGMSLSSAERLMFFRDHNSGFDIAEYDYKNRGAGDIYGTSQHGISADFSVNLANYDLALEIATATSLNKEKREYILQIADKTYSRLCNDIVLN